METPAPERVEKVRKVYVRDLRDKDAVHTVFVVTKKARQMSRSGRPFLVLSLGDKTGEIDARIFEEVEAREALFAAADYVLVQGNVTTHQGRPQIIIEQIERLDPEPIEAREFQPPAEEPKEPNRAVAQIRELVERVQDPHVRQLLAAFLDDPDIARGLPYAPAAKGIHHAYKGGLADHILSVMRLAHRIADHYPMADRDLLLAGALLHDISKVKELSYEKGFDYSDEGRLVGHLVMTAQKIREKASAISGFPPLLEHHITHIVLAHHGQLEYGSPKLPMTLEALLVHLIDTVDSRVQSWLEIMAKDSHPNWTDASKLYDRHLWKGPSPTARHRPPVDSRGRRRGKGHPTGPKPERDGASDGKPAPAPPEAPTDGAPAPGAGLSFPPLSELAGEAPGSGNGSSG
jgi:3'-5' exoribonuclease